MPPYPTYFCMPAKKTYSLSISFPIAYDSRSTMVSSGAQKCSFEKSPRRAWRLPTSIFWCSRSFCVSSSGVRAQPHWRPPHTSQPIIGAFFLHLPNVALCVGLQPDFRPGSNQSQCPTTAQLWEAHRAVVAFNEGSRVLSYGEGTHCVLRFCSLEIVIFLSSQQFQVYKTVLSDLKKKYFFVLPVLMKFPVLNHKEIAYWNLAFFPIYREALCSWRPQRCHKNFCPEDVQRRVSKLSNFKSFSERQCAKIKKQNKKQDGNFFFSKGMLAVCLHLCVWLRFLTSLIFGSIQRNISD